MKKQDMLMIHLRRLALSAGLMASLIFGASARADVIWVGWNSSDWSDAGNWYDTVLNGNYLPTASGSGPAIINPGQGTPPSVSVGLSPIVNSSGNTTYGQLYISIGAGLSVVSGGQLSVGSDLVTGVWGNSLPVEVTGGALNIGGYLNISPGGSYLGHVNISGGTVTAGNLTIGASTNGVMDLSGTGKFVTVIGQLGNINYWINYGHNITAYGGTGTVNVDTNTNPGHIILTGISAPVITARYWTGSASQSWSNPNNFLSEGSNLPGVPESGNTVWLPSWAASAPLINNGGHATLNTLYADKNATIAPGGSLNTTYFKLGQDTNATLTVSGGTLSASNHLDVGGYGGVATMNISNGSVAVGGLYFNLNADTNPVAGSILHLTGGTLTSSGALSINESHATLFNLAGGTLVLPSSQLTAAGIWMNDGAITAYGVAGATNCFNINQTSIPGSLVITAINPGFSADTFTQWNPEVFTNLPPILDQSMPSVPPGLNIPTNVYYSYGAAVGTNGDVYFTEWGNQQIKKYNPVSGALTTLVSGRPQVTGIAADKSGNLFYALDSEVGVGQIIWRTPGGSETTIMSNLTRVRQLATDAGGNLYVVLEEGQILKWIKNTQIATTLLAWPQIPWNAEGIAVAPNGRIYFSTYGRGAGPGTSLSAGAVWARETNGVIHPIAAGFARANDLALHPSGDLYLTCEANVWDNGSSGMLVKIATNGVVTRVLTGIDYCHALAIGSDGKVYLDLVRDNQLVCYDPQSIFATQTVTNPGVTLNAGGATWQQAASANRYPFKLHLTNTNNPADNMVVAGYLQPKAGEASSSLCFKVPVTNLNLSLTPIPYPDGPTNSGIFQLPAGTVDWPYGVVSVQVSPLRVHQRCRWPMTNLGTPQEQSGPGWGEQPVSYLVYVSVVNPPALTIQPWTGNQMRISWPTTATGYALQRSATVSAGYASPSLTVTVEGSENVVYDTRGSGARFYRLIK